MLRNGKIALTVVVVVRPRNPFIIYYFAWVGAHRPNAARSTSNRPQSFAAGIRKILDVYFIRRSVADIY